MKKQHITTLLASTLVSAPVMAKEDTSYFYLTPSYEYMFYQDKTAEKSFSPTTFALEFGYMINQNYGGELKTGFGFEDSRRRTGEGEYTKVKIKQYYNLNVRGNYPLTRRIHAFGKIGYADITAKKTVRAATSVGTDENSNGLSFAAGFNFMMSKDVAFSMQYGILHHSDAVKIENPSVGFMFKF